MVPPVETLSETVSMYRPDSDYKTEYPAVLTTAWKSADGKTAQFFATYRQQNETFTVDLAGTKGARLVDFNGNVLKELDACVCKITLPPHSVNMLLFK